MEVYQKIRIQPQLLDISEEMFGDLPKLKRQFVELYLGSEREYQLEFDLFYLPLLQRVFDEIIWSYGLRNVFFLYPLHCNYEKFRKAMK